MSDKRAQLTVRISQEVYNQLKALSHWHGDMGRNVDQALRDYYKKRGLKGW